MLLFLCLSSHFLDEGIHCIYRCLSINFFLLLLGDLNYGSLFLFDIDYGFDDFNLRNLWINVCVFSLPFNFFLLFIFLIFLCVRNNMLKRVLGKFFYILYCTSRNVFYFSPPVYYLFLFEYYFRLNFCFLITIKVNDKRFRFLRSFILFSSLFGFYNNLTGLLLSGHCALMTFLLLGAQLGAG